MCLDKITKVYKPSLFNLWIPKFAYKSGVGWKAFFDENSIEFPCPTSLSSVYKGNSKAIPTGIWLDEEGYRNIYCKDDKFIEMSGNGGLWGWKCKNYPFGWHILKKEPRFDHLHVNKQVEYKYGHTAGIDATYKAPTIVAKYMKILD